MYKLTLILFAFVSLVIPIFAVPMPVPNEIDGLAQRDTTRPFSGKVRIIYSQPSYNPDLSARRETFSLLASALVA
jgi:hypothetical protein